jgi:hypothetical protein
MDVLCLGRMIYRRPGQPPLLIMDGPDYLDRDACQLICVDSPIAEARYNEQARSVTFFFADSTSLRFIPKTNQSAPPDPDYVSFSVWDGEAYKSKELARTRLVPHAGAP